MTRKIIRRYLPDATPMRTRLRPLSRCRWRCPGLPIRSTACSRQLLHALLYLPTSMWVADACHLVHGLVTMPPMFYFNSRVGTWLLYPPGHSFRLELSWDWLIRELSAL